MQTTDYNQLARCADYHNSKGTSLSSDDFARMSEDDDFAMSAMDIAEISSLAQKQLSKNHTVKLIPLLAIVAAAAIAAVVFIPKSAIEDAAPALKTSVSTVTKTTSDDITAENGIATISWQFEATNADTLVIYDVDGKSLVKIPISGNAATLALPQSAQKYIYKIERYSTDILKKGTILIKN